MEVSKVVIIGAGTMGSGIAQWFAQQMCSVELIDSSTEQVDRALRSIHLSWDKLVTRGKLDSSAVTQMKAQLNGSQIEQSSKDADLVVEAIIEDVEIKRKLFQAADAYYDEKTIFASNTSSFPIESMAGALKETRRAKFLGLHFFNPATIMKLVEVIHGKDSSTELCEELYRWFEQRGKMPAHCKDSPGFIVNRVARNFYGEPLRIVKTEDEAKMRDVDHILKSVGGFKMGPFELMDLIGIDINYSVTLSVWEAFNKEDRFAPHELQEKMVQAGRLGRKTKRGFYTYD